MESLSDVDDEELEGYLLDAEENFFVSNGLVSTNGCPGTGLLGSMG